MHGLTGYLRRYAFNKRVRNWETCTLLAQEEFKKLRSQANYNQNVDPFVYVGKLIMSILTALIGFCLLYFILLVFMSHFEMDVDKYNFLNQIYDGTD